MSHEPPGASFSDLVDAFLRPPKLLRINHRRETPDGLVRVLSHLELWPWRVVLRGARADKNELDDAEIQRQIPSPPEAPGSSTVSVGVLGPEHLASNRAAMEWTLGWSIFDDLGTEYRVIGASSGGAGRWSDFEVTFEPPVPVTVSRVTISALDGDVIEVDPTIE
ncbi:MAG: hypothetical protein HY828_21190 [Actinobacteria bacterium]|nr:hypothetical protein [Actinomycetota bacterium]